MNLDLIKTRIATATPEEKETTIPEMLHIEMKRRLDLFMHTTDKALGQQYLSEIKQLADILECYQKTHPSKPRIKPDNVLSAITNLLGIGLILKHEELNIIASKALGFVMKPRV